MRHAAVSRLRLWTQILCWFAPPRFPGWHVVVRRQGQLVLIGLPLFRWDVQGPRAMEAQAGDVAGNPGIILRQRCQAIRNIVVVRAVELVRRRTMWAVAPQRPQYRARDEQQSQCAATRKYFAGEP